MRLKPSTETVDSPEGILPASLLLLLCLLLVLLLFVLAHSPLASGLSELQRELDRAEELGGGLEGGGGGRGKVDREIVTRGRGRGAKEWRERKRGCD